MQLAGASHGPIVMIESIETLSPQAHDPELAPRLRTFFALVPDDAVRQRFLALAREVARRSRGRAIAGDHVHLTLAFLGDVPATSIVELRRIGDRLSHIGALMEFDTLGAWRASGVAWVAPSRLPPALTALHTELNQSLRDTGFEVEGRPFRPHVTLARRCVQPQARAAVAPIAWSVRKLCLIGSELQAEGTIHTTLAEWPLSLDD